MTDDSRVSGGLPAHRVKLPVRLGAAAIQRHARGRGATPSSGKSRPRDVVSLSFAHRPEKLDATSPATLGPAGPPDDRVALTFNARYRNGGANNNRASNGNNSNQINAAGEGVRLIGTRKPQSMSQARDYLLIYTGENWHLEPVTESITGIKPVQPGPQETIAPPNIPTDYVVPTQDTDRDPWYGKHGRNDSGSDSEMASQLQSPPGSPGMHSSDSSSPGAPSSQRQTAGKSTPGTVQNGKRTLIPGGRVADDNPSPAKPPEHPRPGQTGGKSVGLKSFTTKRRGRRPDGAGSDSDSGSGSSGSSGSSEDSETDSVEYTDESGSDSE